MEAIKKKIEKINHNIIYLPGFIDYFIKLSINDKINELSEILNILKYNDGVNMAQFNYKEYELDEDKINIEIMKIYLHTDNEDYKKIIINYFSVVYNKSIEFIFIKKKWFYEDISSLIYLSIYEGLKRYKEDKYGIVTIKNFIIGQVNYKLLNEFQHMINRNTNEMSDTYNSTHEYGYSREISLIDISENVSVIDTYNIDYERLKDKINLMLEKYKNNKKFKYYYEILEYKISNNENNKNNYNITIANKLGITDERVRQIMLSIRKELDFQLSGNY